MITSPTGAAVRDIARTLRRRWPAAEVYLLPALVQGDGAAGQVADCIARMDAEAARLGIDTIIVARGGGSLEDLWTFNEEPVARAVFAATTPIISGVGHETDVTICDMVADVRAATPTAAAELAVPDAVAMRDRVQTARTRADRRMRQRLDEAAASLGAVLRSAVFRDPLGRVRVGVQRIDELAYKLRAGTRHRFVEARRTAEAPAARLAALHPAHRRDKAAADVDRLLSRLRWALGGQSKRAGETLAMVSARLMAASPAGRMKFVRREVAVALRRLEAVPAGRIRLARQEVTAAARQLEAMSYRSVLRRGFSVTRSADGGILRSSAEASAGAMIETELADGRVSSRVVGGGEVEGGAKRDAGSAKTDESGTPSGGAENARKSGTDDGFSRGFRGVSEGSARGKDGVSKGKLRGKERSSKGSAGGSEGGRTLFDGLGDG